MEQSVWGNGAIFLEPGGGGGGGQSATTTTGNRAIGIQMFKREQTGNQEQETLATREAKQRLGEEREAGVHHEEQERLAREQERPGATRGTGEVERQWRKAEP
jgi:hypothetical protein